VFIVSCDCGPLLACHAADLRDIAVRAAVVRRCRPLLYGCYPEPWLCLGDASLIVVLSMSLYWRRR